MKKYIFAAIAAIAMTASVNAQNNEQVNNDSLRAAQYEKSLNDFEYVKYKKEKDLYTDNIPYYVGNDPEPRILWSAKNCGPYIGLAGAVNSFEGNVDFGGGIVAGWEGRHFGLETSFLWTPNHYNKVDADRHDPFVGITVGIAPMVKIADFCNHHLQFWLMPEYNLMLNYDYHTDVQVNGNISSFNDVEFKGFTQGGALKLRAEYKFWGTPIHVFAQGGYGYQQRYTSDGTEWHGQVKAEVGVTFTLFRGAKWDNKALKSMGLTKSQAKKMARAKATVERY